jgi:hypothetical protein
MTYAYSGEAASWPTTQSVEYPYPESSGYEAAVAAAAPSISTVAGDSGVVGLEATASEPFYKSSIFWGNVVALGILFAVSRYVSKAMG